MVVATALKAHDDNLHVVCRRLCSRHIEQRCCVVEEVLQKMSGCLRAPLVRETHKKKIRDGKTSTCGPNIRLS